MIIPFSVPKKWSASTAEQGVKMDVPCNLNVIKTNLDDVLKKRPHSKSGWCFLHDNAHSHICKGS